MRRLLFFSLAAGILAAASAAEAPARPARPNVLLIITDDQGHGDLGFHGNPKIRTPHLDELARESVQIQNFYVCPVCAPTRSSLLTGRYNYRTGVTDTYIGRALMHPDEVTLAQMLAGAGYRTGHFGKWHLGDNFPMRSIDRGFHEALTLKGGGIGQPSDPPGGESYFDTILQRNGRPVKTTGYVSDVITEGALQFISENHARPFFVYLPFNAPHTPLEVPAKYYERYRAMNLKASDFPVVGNPIPKAFDPDVTAKLYGMVENIDDNVGRLLAKLDELRIATNTIVIFLTDNGPQQPRYNSGMFQLKGTVYEGGIRVPCFIRWPGRLTAGRKVDRIAAHIDLTPTLLELCGAKRPVGVKFDGVSLAPLLRGEKIEWPERTLYTQWHRGDVPELFRCFAARTQNWKLLQPLGVQEGRLTNAPTFKLFDMASDPLETRDIAAEHPDVVARMKRDYEAWFRDVTGARDFTVPSRIHLGTENENPTVLTRQDWRGTRVGNAPGAVGYWEVKVTEALFNLRLTFAAPAGEGATASFKMGAATLQKELARGAKECSFDAVRLPKGDQRLEAWLTDGGKQTGVKFAEVRRLE